MIRNTLLMTALLCSPAAATTISLIGDDWTWSGQSVPAAEAGQQFTYNATIEFSVMHDVAEVHLTTNSPTAPGVVENTFWGFLDEPGRRSYNGNEIILELLGGDFTETPLTAGNFSGLVDSVRLSYFPSGVSTNFDTGLAGDATGFVLIPEPTSLALMLLGLLLGLAVWRPARMDWQ